MHHFRSLQPLAPDVQHAVFQFAGQAFLGQFGAGASAQYQGDVDAALDNLADHLEQHLDLDAILEIAETHGLKVIEDCAHAVEGSYKGKPLGTLGMAGAFSFYPNKNIKTKSDMILKRGAKGIYEISTF